MLSFPCDIKSPLTDHAVDRHHPTPRLGSVDTALTLLIQLDPVSSRNASSSIPGSQRPD